MGYIRILEEVFVAGSQDRLFFQWNTLKVA